MRLFSAPLLRAAALLLAGVLPSLAAPVTPTHVVASGYSSPGTRAEVLSLLTDGAAGASEAECFDTSPASYLPTQFVGLLYLEDAGSNRATRLDSIRVDLGTGLSDGGEFARPPRLFVLKHNSDPNTLDPATDDRYTPLPCFPQKSVNAAGRPAWTFDLSTLPEQDRTGYGFAVVGPGSAGRRFITVAELSAQTAAVLPPSFPAEPAYWSFGGKRYGLTFTRGTWEQCEAEAVARGGHLARVDSAALNEWLVQTFGAEQLFLGAKRSGGVYQWPDGTAVASGFTSWQAGQPDGQDYVTLNCERAYGRWSDVNNPGFPETSSYRGIIELPGLSGVSPLQQLTAAGTANIFGAGHHRDSLFPAPGAATPGNGSPAPYAAITPYSYGTVVTFPSVEGSVYTGLDYVEPEGGRNPTRAGNFVDVSPVSGGNGLSGYRNLDNIASLVGVFLADTEPGSAAPATLNFSASGLGQDFEFLSPQLGQVFFIGDGRRASGDLQYFLAPAGATRLYVGVPDANYNGSAYTGTPFGYEDNSGGWVVRLQAEANVTPRLKAAQFPLTGGHLADFTIGGDGVYSYALLTGALPTGLTLSSSGQITGTAANGIYDFSIGVADGSGHSGSRAYHVEVANPVAAGAGFLAWLPGASSGANVVGSPHARGVGGALKFAPGRVGQAFDFSATGAYAELNSSDALCLMGDMTMEAWIRPLTAGAGTERTIVSQRDLDNLNISHVLFLETDGRLSFSSRRNGGEFIELNTTAALPAESWTHVAATSSGGELRLYVNGRQVAVNLTYPSRPLTSGKLTVGATSTSAGVSGRFLGQIDELSLYERALSAAELLAIVQAGSGGKARYDAVTDFASSPNTAGALWRYGTVVGTGNTFTPLSAPSSVNTVGTTFTQRSASGDHAEPYFRLLPGTAPYSSTQNGGTVVFYPETLTAHPASGDVRPVARWTAPAAGRYVATGHFRVADNYPGFHTVEVALRHNGQLRAQFPGFQTPEGDGVALSTEVVAAAGDTIDFVVGPEGSIAYDSVSVSASVVAIGSSFRIVPTELPALGQSITAEGGATPYTFSIVGPKPEGLQIAGDGQVQSIPTAAGQYGITVRATDSQQNYVEKTFAFTIVAEAAPLSGMAAWFPGELHPHDVLGGGIGTEVNGVGYTAGKAGRAFLFDGENDAITVKSEAMNRVPLTVETWIRMEARSGGDHGTGDSFWPTNIISGDKANYGGMGLGANCFTDGTSHLFIEVLEQNPAYAFHRVPGVSFTAGQWYHVALVITPGVAKTYVNGELKDTWSYAQAAPHATPFYRLGRHNEDFGYDGIAPGIRFFKGAIDELTIYRRALSAGEIQSIYAADVLGKRRDDAARDFDPDANDSSFVFGSFAAGAAPGGTFSPFPEAGRNDHLRIWQIGSAADPNALKNVAETSQSLWSAGRLSLHPGPDGSYAAARWVAPADGTYAVFNEFRRLDPTSTVNTWEIALNGVSLRAPTEENVLSGSRPSARFQQTLSLHAGDTIDFSVGNGNDGFSYDTVGLTASVTPVPPLLPLTAPGAVAIATSNPPQTGQAWTFSTPFAGNEADVSVRLQYTANPANPALWADLPGADGTGRMTLTNGTATLLIPSLTLPEGAYYFRALAQAPGYEAVGGPTTGRAALAGSTGADGALLINPAPEIAAAGELKITTKAPAAAGRAWTFRTDRPNNVAGLRLRVQYTLTPTNSGSWQDLPGDPYLVPAAVSKGEENVRWQLVVARLNLPAGAYYFRIVSTAPGAPALPSPVYGAAALDSKKPFSEPLTVASTISMELDPEAGIVGDDHRFAARAGEKLEYSGRFRSNGAKGVSLLIPVPAGTEYDSADEALSGGTRELVRQNPKKPTSDIVAVKWTLSDSASQVLQSRRLFVRIKLGTRLGTVVNNTATLASTDRGSVIGTFATFNVNAPISITVERTDGLFSPLPRGGIIDYRIVATNDASFAMKNGKVEFQIPTGTFLENATVPRDPSTQNAILNPAGGNNPAVIKATGTKTRDTLSWYLGNLRAGARHELHVQVRIKFDTEAIAITTSTFGGRTPVDGYSFSAEGTNNEGGFVTKNNNNFAVLVEAFIDPPQLAVSKSPTGETSNVIETQDATTKQKSSQKVAAIRPGQEVTYTMTLRNDGKSPVRNVKVYDSLPANGTFLPSSLLFDGQPFTAGVKLYVGNTETAPSSAQAGNITGMVISIGDLAAQGLPGSRHTISYRWKALRGTRQIAAGTFITSDYGYITSDSLEKVTHGENSNTTVQVLQPVTFGEAKPFNLPTEAVADQITEIFLPYENIGQLPGRGCRLEIPVPKGTSFEGADFVDPATNLHRAAVGREHAPVASELGSGPAVFQLDELSPGEKGMARLKLKVLSPLTGTIKTARRVEVRPRCVAYDTDNSVVNGLVAARHPAAAAAKPKEVASSSPGLDMRVREQSDPKVFISRQVPISAIKGETMSYTLIAGNISDGAAQNTKVGMQVPYGLSYVSAAGATIIKPASSSDSASGDLKVKQADTTVTTTLNARRRAVDGKVDIVTWNLGALPGHSVAVMSITFRVDPNFPMAAAEDNSCYISSSNAPSCVAGLATTQVRSGNQFFAFWEGVNAFVSGLGGWFNREQHERLAPHVATLGDGAQNFMVGGSDIAKLDGTGAVITSLGFNRVLVLAPTNMVAAGGGNIVAAGGGNIVAAGGGNLISVKEVPGFGTLTATNLVKNLPSLVAAGAGNLVAAGAGNLVQLKLIGQDGGSLVGMDGASLIGTDGASLGTFSVTGAGASFNPISGASLRISSDPGRLVSANSLGMVAAGGGNMVAAGAGNLVAAGAGNIVAAGGGNMVAAGGGNMVAAGGGNLVTVSSGMVAAGGGNIVAAGGGN